MVIDLKKIKLRKSIDDNALWVVEQIPGLVVSGDQTPILRAGKKLLQISKDLRGFCT